jgi:uncharacterized protein (TIGR01777 family)
MRVFITGGTGLVGTRLIRRLLDRKDDVVLLTRRPDVARQQWESACGIVEGDPMQAGDWMRRVEECDGVVNLAGANIFAKRWRAWYKELMRDSRIKSTANVAEALSRSPRRADGSPRVLVSGSAVGYYGPHGDEELTEDSPPGDDYLAKLSVDWEKAARAAEPGGVRVVLLRIGVVLDKQGGALQKMLRPFEMFVGGKVGSGRQVMSWIHHDDLVGIILLGLDNAEAAGPINGTAPNPVTNKQFAKALGRALGRPSFFPTPGFMLRLVLGPVASVVTTGQRVLPKKALALGYQFRFPEVDAALQDALA